MPRAEAGTPKAIGNAIKAKGLQKLKFYCEVCQKQCRDANGFKCHMSSENHQRQMLIVAENPNSFLQEYSNDFFKGFMHLFKTRFGSKRVFANAVYQEYIKDRHHVHMNATRWFTLGSFVAFLGKTGHAEVDRTERGWYITYIDRDPETLRRQDLFKKKDKMEKDYDERMRTIINEQIERGKELSRPIDETNEEDKVLKRDDDKIVLKLDLNKKSSDKNESSNNNDLADKDSDNKNDTMFESDSDGEEDDEHSNPTSSFRKSTTIGQIKISSKSQKASKRCALDEIIEEEVSKKKSAKKDNWIEKNLVVKLVTKKVPEKYQKKKGVIEKVESKYLAYVRMNESNALIKMDQNDLETVIPKEGNLVRIVNGGYQGETAKLLRLNQDDFNATVRIEKGYHKGKEINVEFEEICKFVQ